MSVHPRKPHKDFLLVNVTGTCGKGIFLVNIKRAKLRDIKVTGFSGPLLSTSNVAGTGLEGAVAAELPKLPDPVPVQPYKLGSPPLPCAFSYATFWGCAPA